MTIRRYERDKDAKAVQRIWLEIGWTDKDKQDPLDILLDAACAWVAEIDGQAECLVTTMPAAMRYLDDDLALSCVTGVATGRIARKRGLASRLAARAVAEDAAGGALVSALGMFEQGFYNQLGFGSGPYVISIKFDPAQLNVPASARTPQRIGPDDWQVVHAARLARYRGHGACNVEPAGITRAEMVWSKNGFGLGYRDRPDGELTHHLWFRTNDVESGPYNVEWMSYQTPEQFIELMGLIRSLGDQVRSVEMCQPQGIQIQDLLNQPFRFRTLSEKSKHAGHAKACAYWQVRICDLAGCLARTHLPGPPVRFNLRLTDPITRFLDESQSWRGIAGDYVVSLGPTSSAAEGSEASLATLCASVGAFSRMWLGAVCATGLTVTDDLSAPPQLLSELDRVLRLPLPQVDWDF